MLIYIIACIIFFSSVSIILTIIDKNNAINQIRRVRESNLFLVAALGGATSMLMTMRIIRHKTRKPKFMIGLPIIIILHIIIIVYLVVNNLLY